MGSAPKMSATCTLGSLKMSHGKRDSADVIVTDYGGGPNVIIRVLTRRRKKGQKQWEM